MQRQLRRAAMFDTTVSGYDAGGSDEQTGDTTETTTTTEASAQTTGDATGTNGGNEGRTFTQADVDRMIEDRLKREREKAERDRQKAEADAEAKRLEEQKQFEELANKRQQRIDELEPTAQKAERYEAALKTHLETQRTGLPEHILEILDRMDVTDQLEYIAKHHDKLKPAGTERNGIPPVRNGDKNTATHEDRVNQYLKQAGIQV